MKTSDNEYYYSIGKTSDTTMNVNTEGLLENENTVFFIVLGYNSTDISDINSAQPLR